MLIQFFQLVQDQSHCVQTAIGTGMCRRDIGGDGLLGLTEGLTQELEILLCTFDGVKRGIRSTFGALHRAVCRLASMTGAAFMKFGLAPTT